MKLHNFIVLFGTGVILIAFLVAIAYTKRAKPKCYKYIFAAIILGLLISVNTILNGSFKFYNYKVSRILENCISFFQSIMFSLFLIEHLKKSKFIQSLKSLFYLLIIIEIILIIVQAINNSYVYPRLSLFFCIIVLTIFYFRDLLQNKPTLILANSSVFWIVIGIFFSFCISFPIYSLIPFLVKHTEYRNLRFQIFSIVNMSLIVLYCTIIKSYICLKHPQNLL